MSTTHIISHYLIWHLNYDCNDAIVPAERVHEGVGEFLLGEVIGLAGFSDPIFVDDSPFDPHHQHGRESHGT